MIQKRSDRGALPQIAQDGVWRPRLVIPPRQLSECDAALCSSHPPSAAYLTRFMSRFRRPGGVHDDSGAELDCCGVLTDRVRAFWMRCSSEAEPASPSSSDEGVCHGTDHGSGSCHARQVIDGAPIVFVHRRSLGNGGSSPTLQALHWPWQNVLLGELQFSQVLQTVPGNFQEGCSFPRPSDNEVPTWAAPIGRPMHDAPPLPRSMSLDDTPVMFELSVHMADTLLHVEGVPGVVDAPGDGRALAQLTAERSLLKIVMTESNSMRVLWTSGAVVLRDVRGCGESGALSSSVVHGSVPVIQAVSSPEPVRADLSASEVRL